MNTSPSTEERIWAVLAHLSALAFGMGILLPIIGWSEQRRKSKYISFQCLQSLGYQSLGFTAWLLSYLLLFIGLLVAVIVMSYQAERDGQVFDPLTGFVPAVLSVLVVVFLVIYGMLPVVASIACALGRDFHYPIMGHRLATYLGYASSPEGSTGMVEAREERWVAAMGHFSVIIFLWGMLAPLAAWISQGKRSVFLKFQSIQTLVFQSGVTLLFFVGTFILTSVAALSLVMVTSFTTTNNDDSGSIPGLVVLFVLMIIAMVIVLIVPLFHILGQWAGYRVLKGDDYRYPIVGRLVERWMVKSATESGSRATRPPERTL